MYERLCLAFDFHIVCMYSEKIKLHILCNFLKNRKLLIIINNQNFALCLLNRSIIPLKKILFLNNLKIIICINIQFNPLILLIPSLKNNTSVVLLKCKKFSFGLQ